MAFYLLANLAESTLDGAINDAVTALSVAAGEGALFPATGDFICRINDADDPETEIEFIKVTTRVTDGFTVIVREFIDSARFPACAHASGDPIALVIVAETLEEMQATIDAKAPVGCINIFVASSTATAAEKAMATATYTADATEDDVQLNAALAAIA